MTQKELAYFEDAINHESAIISILNHFVSEAENDEIISFIQDELNNHETLKNNLLNVMEEASNEW